MRLKWQDTRQTRKALEVVKQIEQDWAQGASDKSRKLAASKGDKQDES